MIIPSGFIFLVYFHKLENNKNNIIKYIIYKTDNKKQKGQMQHHES